MSKVINNYLLDGVIFILIGIVLLVWPQETLNLAIRIVGGAIAAMGTCKILMYFIKKEDDRRIGKLLLGILQGVLGIALLLRPGFFISFIPVIVGAMLLYGGIVLFLRAWKVRKMAADNVRIAFILSFIYILLAVICFADPPILAVHIMQFNGIVLIFEGLSIISIMFMIGRNMTQEE